MTNKSAIYARSATDDMAELEEQVRACQIAGAALGGLPGPIYAETAGGGRLASCPVRQAMLEAAQRGEFQHLIVRDLARLSRDQAISVLLLGVLAVASVQVHTLQGPSELEAVIGCDAAAQLVGLLGKGKSFDEQVAQCRMTAHRLGYKLVPIHADRPSAPC